MSETKPTFLPGQPEIRPWLKVDSLARQDFRIFKVRTDRKVSPRTRRHHDFFVIESLDWVNVIALTPNQELVMVEQYRHGTDSIELEVPGGIMDPDDRSVEIAGLRELSEETGFEGRDPMLLGRIYPNPAIMNNTCHTVLVRDCEYKQDTRFDHGEDLATRLVPLADIPDLIRTGKIRHALIVVALYHLELWRQKQASAGA